MNLLLIVPIDTYDKFNLKLISSNKKTVLEGYHDMVNIMFKRYLIFVGLAIIIMIFSIVYLMIFCTIYDSTMMSWLLGSIVSLIIFFIVIQLGSPLILTILRSWSRSNNFKNNRLVRNLYQTSLYVL
jgi:hypothetical protein